MKKCSALLTVTILICVCAAQAQERQMLKVAVPFSFTAENTNFPAGTVTVYLLNPFNLVRVQSSDGHHVAIIRGLPVQKSAEQKESALVFDRIAGQFFLAQVRERDNDIRRELPLGSSARELTARNHNGQQVASMITIPAR